MLEPEHSNKYSQTQKSPEAHPWSRSLKGTCPTFLMHVLISGLIRSGLPCVTGAFVSITHVDNHRRVVLGVSLFSRIDLTVGGGVARVSSTAWPKATPIQGLPT